MLSFPKNISYICAAVVRNDSSSLVNADVVELVDTLDLGSSALRRGGSSPFIRTQYLGNRAVWPCAGSTIFLPILP